MLYRSLSVAALGVSLAMLAACKGSDSGMSSDLARDLASAKANDALTLAPRAGVQTVVSAEELSPQGRTRIAPSRRSSRPVARRTPHRDRATSAPSAVVASSAGAATTSSVSASPSASDATEAAVIVSAPSPRPQPVDVSYPSSDAGSSRGDGGGAGSGGIGGIGGIIGAIGGAILRGGVVGGDGDHCDPRGHPHGGILVNHRGPILRGTF